MPRYRLTPDEVLINSILDGCEKCQEYKKASDLFDYIKNLKVNIPCMSFSIMMKVFYYF
jgi:pentatricopeptide repeat protein